MNIPGFYRAEHSNLSGDPAVDGRPIPHKLVEQGEIFYISGTVDETPVLPHVSKGMYILEPIQREKETRYLSRLDIFSPASPSDVSHALKENIKNARPSLSNIISQYISKD